MVKVEVKVKYQKTQVYLQGQAVGVENQQAGRREGEIREVKVALDQELNQIKEVKIGEHLQSVKFMLVDMDMRQGPMISNLSLGNSERFYHSDLRESFALLNSITQNQPQKPYRKQMESIYLEMVFYRPDTHCMADQMSKQISSRSETGK